MKILIDYIFRVLFIFGGAAYIALAIQCFNEQKYFVFGIFVMLTFYMAIYLLKAAIMDILP